MRNIILCESRNAFRNDITTALMLDSYPLNLTMTKNFEEFLVAADKNKDYIPVISDSILNEYDGARLPGKTVFGYASTPDGIRSLQENNVSCMGLLKTSEQLLSALTAVSLPVMGAARKETPKSSPPPSKAVLQESPTAAPAVPSQQVPEPAPQQPIPTQGIPGFPNMTPEQLMQIMQMFQAAIPQAAATHPVTPMTGSQLKEHKAEQLEAETDMELNKDILMDEVEKRKKTRVVSVYAAKGGVGKTSLATELAVCLALTSNGRRKFRVCIVDYNIDFGDVASTLELSETGPNMTYWATEIRKMLTSGRDPDEIQFSRQEMEGNYLQKMEKTGLYVLVAPIMHEDSMFIKAAELQVMLRNIVDNGEFDYVICDTGNNTRDSSVIAMDSADYILLVATQDVTTANCNASVLRTLRDTGFDTDKVRLVINNVMPARETGISVKEVEETFPYECVCRIKRTPDIIRANNLGKPLVYNPKHEYTRQIQRIVQFVTSGEVVHDAAPPKKFGRKRKEG